MRCVRGAVRLEALCSMRACVCAVRARSARCAALCVACCVAPSASARCGAVRCVGARGCAPRARGVPVLGLFDRAGGKLVSFLA
jgi:hypothetical protein